MEKSGMKCLLQTLFRIFSHLLPTGMKFPIMSGPLRGRKWIIGAAAGEAKGISIIVNKSETQQVNYAIKKMGRNTICFDIGANVGFYTLLFSQFAKEVYAFEPLPRNLEYLIRLNKINNIYNAKIIPCAISDFTGISSFSEGINNALGKLDKKGNLPVLVTTCDKFVSETKIIPDMLKIDVEGAELNVLKGAKKLLESFHPFILLSVHSSQLRSNCLDLLEEVGYKIFIPLDSEKKQEATEFAIHHNTEDELLF